MRRTRRRRTPRALRLAFVAGALGALGALGACSGELTGGSTDGGAPCTGDDGCPATHTCQQGVCVPRSSGCQGVCAEHAFCDTDGQCKGSTQKVCASDAECGGGFVCPQSAGVCVEPCVLDSECDLGFICNNAFGGCAECAFDSQCLDPSRPHCHADSGRCVACVAAGQCEPGTHCVLDTTDPTQTYTCARGCLTEADCAPGDRCEGAGGGSAGQCVECTVATEADDCLDSTRPFCHPDLRHCTQCVRSDHCATGQVCSPDGTCVECLQDDHCPLGQVCDTGTSTCVPGCTSNARCPPSGAPSQTLCDTSVGAHGTCVECKTTSDCAPGTKCVSGACVEGCDTSATCPPDRPVCNLVANRCVECIQNADCPNQDLTCDKTTNTCVCLDVGDACTRSAQCGNPPSAGVCAGISRCVTRVLCPPNTWRTISGLCGQQCTIKDDPYGCPSGTICRRVEYEGGTSPNLQCVPTSTCG